MTKLIRPLLYHCRGGVNDAHWIIQRMKVIPESLRQEVSDKYENLFLRNKNGRELANKYLDGVASEYRVKREKQAVELKKPPARKPKSDKKYNSDCGLWSKKI